jgi:hypothetical protein
MPDDRRTGTGALGQRQYRQPDLRRQTRRPRTPGNGPLAFGGQFLYAKGDGEESARCQAYGSAAYALNERSHPNKQRARAARPLRRLPMPALGRDRLRLQGHRIRAHQAAVRNRPRLP